MKLFKLMHSGVQELTELYRQNNKEDEEIWQVQSAAQHHYQAIWYTLNAREKYLLFDLAEDGLINLHDGYSLRLLMKKGLIIRNEETWQLSLFNRSFRNFILTVITLREAEKIKQQVNSGWQWSHLKTPVLIVVIAIMAFMMISQHQAYTKVIGVLSALAALIPTVNGVINAFKSDK